MAKHSTKASKASGHKIEDFAEDLGRLLGNAQAKAQGWMGQRQAIAKHLAEIRDTASTLLADLGQQTQRGLRRGKRAYVTAATTVTSVSPQKKRKLSAKARKAISDAQKKRWAAVRAAKKTDRK
jgi:hypothetical protein